MSTADNVLAALQPYGLKQDGHNKYRCNSPIRPGSNSHAFSVTIDDSEHGAYFDHVSGDKGSLYDLAKQLNIPLPESERMAVVSTKRHYAGIEDYAQAHGIPKAVLEGARWREVMREGRLALEIPTRTGLRWRFLDGQKPFYKSEKGYQRTWYGLTARALQLVGAGSPLVICNGEISCVAGQYYGLPAICVTGGENTVPPELLDELKAAIDVKTPIIVALDCDKKGQDTATKLTAQLKSNGLNARAVDLGLSSGGDLADYCMLYAGNDSPDVASLPTLAETASRQAHRAWIIVKAKDLHLLPKVSWLVPGEIPEKGMTVIYGPSGIGKSFIALDYALKISQTKTVVYVAAEGQSGYEQRIKAWCKHYNQTEDNLYICLGSPNLMEDDDLEAFIGEITALSPVLCVVDTLAMSMLGGDENSARDMGRIINASRKIQFEADCSVIFVHHMNKGGLVERGSSALRGASDVMIRVTGDDDVIVVEAAKVKDGAPFDPRYMKLLPIETDLGESRVIVLSDNVIQREEDPLTRQQIKVLEVLAMQIFIEDGATFTEIAELTGLSIGSVQRTLSKLLFLKRVNRPEGHGKSYKLSEFGEKYLESVNRIESLESPDSENELSHFDSADSSDSSDSTPLQTTFLNRSESNQYTGGL